MGNTIKLPVSHHSQMQEIRQKDEKFLKKQLIVEISNISTDITRTDQQIDQLTSKLEQLNQHIDYYKEIILELSKKLDHLYQEQLNTNLAHENCVEKGNEYLSDSNSESETYEEMEFSDSTITDLQNQVALLNNEVAMNEEIIAQQIKKYSFN